MVTQFGISVITPILLCVWFAAWLRDKFSLGDWAVIVGIVIGAGAGIMSMLKMIKQMSRAAEKEDE